MKPLLLEGETVQVRQACQHFIAKLVQGHVLGRVDLQLYQGLEGQGEEA
jgi:hypothetical protein